MSLEDKYRHGTLNIPGVGIKQVKTFGAPVLTTRTANNPDRIRYYGDPISALDLNAKRVMPSLGFRMKHSAHSFSGLSIPDKVEEHDLIVQPLTVQPNDNKSQQLTE